jgi:hypothetical protein
MFVAEVTDEVILGLDVRAYDVSVDFGRHIQRLGRDVSLWRPGARLRSSLTLASEVIPARCESVVTARLQGTLDATNGVLEPSLKTSQKNGLCISRTLIRAWQKGPVRIINVSNEDQMLAGSTVTPWAAVNQSRELRPQTI